MKNNPRLLMKHLRNLICLAVCVSAFMIQNGYGAKPLDPSLERFLAPSIKHAIGMRQVADEYMKQFAKRMGREPAFVQAYSLKSSWPDFRSSIPRTLTDHWPNEKATYIYTVQMLRAKPLTGDDIPEALRKKYPKDPMNLEAACEGMYDEQWAWFGKRLSQYSQKDLDKLVLRPGHEFNGDWYQYSVRPEGSTPETSAKLQKLYKMYFQRIHRVVMKELNGKRVLWDFCPSGGQIHTAEGPPEVNNSYPGDEYVDIIGIDRYAGNVDHGDKGKGSWEEAKNSAFAWVSHFAAEHGKMTAVDETSIVWSNKKGQVIGSDDYPEWFIGLAEWMKGEVDARRLHHVTLFDRDTPAKYHACVTHQKTIPGREKQELNFPKSAAKIIELFGGKLSEEVTRN